MDVTEEVNVSTELPELVSAPTFASMLGKWKRFGAFVVAAACVVAAVSIGTRGVEQGALQILARVALVGAMSYLITFVVWPRRSALPRDVTALATDATELKTDTDVMPTPKPKDVRPVPDKRPVAVIAPRPAGSRPASRVHIAETPTARNPRGRHVESRQSSERDFRWPAQK